LAELVQLQADGYGAVSFADDQFLFWPKRIEEICRGITDRGITLRWGCEGRVDSKCTELFPLMASSGCRSVAFGVESGSQRVLDRICKKQTLEQIESAVNGAKRAGIETVHGFFLIGCPDETADDIRQTFSLASRLLIDSLGVNRLEVFRGTPLWREYVERGLVNDATDWHKSLECSEIDPTVLDKGEIQRLRAKGMRRLISYKLLHHPLQVLRLLRRLAKNMPLRDVLHLVAKPLLGRKPGDTRSRVLTRAVEDQEVRKVAADLSRLSDEALEEAVLESEATSPRPGPATRPARLGGDETEARA
jgi:radical SAM superfamily enzyme YgiQ (UPF0313 family)